MCSNHKHTAAELEVHIQLFLQERVSYHELNNNYGNYVVNTWS